MQARGICNVEPHDVDRSGFSATAGDQAQDESTHASSFVGFAGGYRNRRRGHAKDKCIVGVVTRMYKLALASCVVSACMRPPPAVPAQAPREFQHPEAEPLLLPAANSFAKKHPH